MVVRMHLTKNNLNGNAVATETIRMGLMLRQNFSYSLTDALESVLYRPHILVLEGDAAKHKLSNIVSVAEQMGIQPEWAKHLDIEPSTVTQLALETAKYAKANGHAPFFWTPAAWTNFILSTCYKGSLCAELVSDTAALAPMVEENEIALKQCIAAYKLILPADALIEFESQAAAFVATLK